MKTIVLQSLWGCVTGCTQESVMYFIYWQLYFSSHRGMYQESLLKSAQWEELEVKRESKHADLLSSIWGGDKSIPLLTISSLVNPGLQQASQPARSAVPKSVRAQVSQPAQPCISSGLPFSWLSSELSWVFCFSEQETYFPSVAVTFTA